MVRADAFPFELAACACPEGTVARASFDPFGQALVACVDPAGSLMNPSAPGASDDPCVDYDCGLGTCRALNMTPACACDAGALGVGFVDGDGRRHIRCVAADERVIIPPRTPRPRAVGGARPAEVDPAMGRVVGGGGVCAVSRGPRDRGAVWMASALLSALALRRRSR